MFLDSQWRQLMSWSGTHYYNRCWRHAAAHVLSPPLRFSKNDELTFAKIWISLHSSLGANNIKKYLGRTKTLPGTSWSSFQMEAFRWETEISSNAFIIPINQSIKLWMPYNCSHDQCTGTDNCTFTSKQKALGINDFTKVWLTKYDILESESVLLIQKMWFSAKMRLQRKWKCS